MSISFNSAKIKCPFKEQWGVERCGEGGGYAGHYTHSPEFVFVEDKTKRCPFNEILDMDCGAEFGFYREHDELELGDILLRIMELIKDLKNSPKNR